MGMMDRQYKNTSKNDILNILRHNLTQCSGERSWVFEGKKDRQRWKTKMKDKDERHDERQNERRTKMKDAKPRTLILDNVQFTWQGAKPNAETGRAGSVTTLSIGICIEFVYIPYKILRIHQTFQPPLDRMMPLVVVEPVEERSWWWVV
jgi:hypothetical protein